MYAMLIAAVITAAPAKEEKLTLYAFQATWCGPCHRMEPVLKRIEAKGYKVVRIDVDKQPKLAEKYGVKALPTCVSVDKQGQEKGRVVGEADESMLISILRGVKKVVITILKILVL